MRLHFFEQQLQCGVVHAQVVVQQAQQPAVIGRVSDLITLDHRCQRDIHLQLRRGKALLQGVGDTVGADFQRFHRHQCLAPDHLHGLVQPFPDDRCAQNVVTLNDGLQGGNEMIQPVLFLKAEDGARDIDIPHRLQQMVEQNTGLEWCQRVDILHIMCTARHGRHHGIDLRLR